MTNYEEIMEAVSQARDLKHNSRAMRVTLECGHMRLLPWHVTVMGIGAKTGCGICKAPEGQDSMERQVVNVEETGVLHESWHRRDS